MVASVSDTLEVAILLLMSEYNLAAVVGRFNPLDVPIVDLVFSLLVFGVLRLFSTTLDPPLDVNGVVFKLRFGVCTAAPFFSAPFFKATEVEGLIIPNVFFGAGVLGAAT